MRTEKRGKKGTRDARRRGVEESKEEESVEEVKEGSESRGTARAIMKSRK